MSGSEVKDDGVHPALRTAAVLNEIGFRTFDSVGLLAHGDGRVAAIAPDGNHQVFERLVDAINWLLPILAKAEEISEAVEQANAPMP